MNAMEERAHQFLERRRKMIGRLYQSNDEEGRRLDAEVEPDWPDRAAARESSTVLRRLTDAEQRELKEIDEALYRITEGTFGRCQRCGHAIGRQRLQAIPETRYCLSCSDTIAQGAVPLSKDLSL